MNVDHRNDVYTHHVNSVSTHRRPKRCMFIHIPNDVYIYAQFK